MKILVALSMVLWFVPATQTAAQSPLVGFWAIQI